GCDMRCSFCIIPSTRGRQRSRPVEEVVAEVEALAAGGYAEVVVTGVQISEYDDHGRRLYDLVSALLERTSIPRLRLTSIAPWKFDERLLELWQDPRLARHVHMSLQSGCTATLRRMRRPYSADRYAELAAELRAAIPGLALTTDVIVGFPGETDEEFRQSLEFVGELAFARPHVFTYSPRQGTHAATLPHEVPHAVKKARVAEMLDVAARSERAFWRSQVAQEATVVWEELRRPHTGGERLTGLTDHYIRVFAPQGQGSEADLGRLAKVRLEAVKEKGMLASPLRSSSAPPAGSRAQDPGRENASLFRSAVVPASFLARS
ncbi:MAG: radical SAM protein, partial [Holophagales bacterium]|nr:radical SAM protein [Holophagales bacterium]